MPLADVVLLEPEPELELELELDEEELPLLVASPGRLTVALAASALKFSSVRVALAVGLDMLVGSRSWI